MTTGLTVAVLKMRAGVSVTVCVVAMTEETVATEVGLVIVVGGGGT